MNATNTKTDLHVELANYEGELAAMASKIRLGLMTKTSNPDYDAAYERVYTIAKRMHELQRAGGLDGLADDMLSNMAESAMIVNSNDWFYWMNVMAPEKPVRETCTLIVSELDSGLGFHFCSHDLLSGSTSNLWFPLHDKAQLHQEVERVMVMNHQVINVTRLDPVRSTDKSTDYTVTYNVNSARPRPENRCSKFNLSVTPHGTWGAASADDTLLLLGLPEALQSMIRQVLECPIDFPEKAKKIERMFKSVKNGDHSLLRVQAAEIIEFQDNLTEGRPQHLNTLIERVQTEYCFYPDRETHMRVLEKALLNGDFSLAKVQAGVIITSQENLRSGANRLLKQLIDKANHETVEFPRRDEQLREMNASMIGQDFGLAEALANGIIARSDKAKAEQA
ncbi:hypothetical protein EO763_23445 (plasmid) [Pectobacterium odoriferum]|uniref:hypothetical protein n=1 Tax=Pectobacterium odoriferum TaxID=78398 RepID=UPI001373AE0B|nr:hypothetical protein [Pectobacterium odoriferum]QHP82846.1 hypothetical protein EO763_23445 [Pectobacterium odoriferum]